MKLSKKPGSGIITAQIKTATGVRTISTGTSDQRVAKKLLKEANVETIESLSQAGALSHELIRKLTVGGSMTVEQAIEEWSKWLADTSGSDRTTDNHNLYVNAWARSCKCLNQKLMSITEGHISRWVNAEDGTKLATRRVRLAAVRSFFKFCSIRQYLNPDPARMVNIKAKLLSHEQKETTQKVCFTDEEFDKVADHLIMKLADLMGHEKRPSVQKKIDTARFWLAALYIGRYSGLRLGDICSLEWSSISKPGKLIVHTDKRDVRIELPLSKELQRGISNIEPNKTKFCFPEQDRIARDGSQRAKLSTQFGRILEAAGVTGHSFHDLRHTLASELNVQGQSLEDIAKALGHGSKESTKTYIHAPSERAEKQTSLPR